MKKKREENIYARGLAHSVVRYCSTLRDQRGVRVPSELRADFFGVARTEDLRNARRGGGVSEPYTGSSNRDAMKISNLQATKERTDRLGDPARCTNVTRYLRRPSIIFWAPENCAASGSAQHPWSIDYSRVFRNFILFVVFLLPRRGRFVFVEFFFDILVSEYPK